jgi:prefoldin beta subunit
MAEGQQQWQQYQSKAKELEGVTAGLTELKNELQTLKASSQKHQAQYQENDMTLSELQRLGPEDAVFKQIGPALVKQEAEEALDTVKKRLDFIKAKLDDLDKQIAAEQKQFDARRGAAVALQQDMQNLQQRLQQLQLQQQQQQQAQPPQQQQQGQTAQK